MSLPSSRNTTFTAADPVKSNDLNAMQDCIVGGKHGDKVMTMHPFGTTLAPAGFGVDWSPVDKYMHADALGELIQGVPLHTGDRIKSFTVAVYGEAPNTADLQIAIAKYSAAGVTTDITSVLTVSNPAAAWADHSIDLSADLGDYTLAAGESIFIVYIAGAVGIRLGATRITYDRP